MVGFGNSDSSAKLIFFVGVEVSFMVKIGFDDEDEMKWKIVICFV